MRRARAAGRPIVALRRGALGVLSAIILLAAAPAFADAAAQSAAALFHDGEEAFAQHDYRRAAALFEQANRVRPHPATLWNAARARQRAGEKAHAANLYARVVRDAPSGPDADDSRAALATLGGDLGRLRVVLGKGVTLPRLDAESIHDGEIVYVEPGPHLVEASLSGGAGGGAVRKTVDVRAAELQDVELAAPEPSVAPPMGAGGLPPGIAYSLGATTLVVGGFATWSAVDTLAYYNGEYSAHRTSANFDVGLGKQLRTNILLGVVVLFGGLTVLAAYYTDFHRPLLGSRGARSFVARLGPGGVAFD